MGSGGSCTEAQIRTGDVLFGGVHGEGTGVEGTKDRGVKKIIGHISFDICHLLFVPGTGGLQMINDKCQMIYDQ